MSSERLSPEIILKNKKSVIATGPSYSCKKLAPGHSLLYIFLLLAMYYLLHLYSHLIAITDNSYLSWGFVFYSSINFLQILTDVFNNIMGTDGREFDGCDNHDFSSGSECLKPPRLR